MPTHFQFSSFSDRFVIISNKYSCHKLINQYVLLSDCKNIIIGLYGFESEQDRYMSWGPHWFAMSFKFINCTSILNMFRLLLLIHTAWPDRTKYLIGIFLILCWNVAILDRSVYLQRSLFHFRKILTKMEHVVIGTAINFHQFKMFEIWIHWSIDVIRENWISQIHSRECCRFGISALL